MSKNTLKHQMVHPDGHIVAAPRSALTIKDGVYVVDPTKLDKGFSVYVPSAPAAVEQASPPAAQKGR